MLVSIIKRCKSLRYNYVLVTNIHSCTTDTTTNVCLFVNYLLLYVLMAFWCKLPEDGDNAETCRS
jgi:hypothetical protein